jgi:phage baseplate assembly protein V
MFAFEITELHRRLANVVLLGKIVEADYSQTIPKLKIKIGNLQTAWLPMLTQRAGNDVSWWPLEVGEQVLVLSPSGELNQGVVLGAINQKAFAAPGNSADVHRQMYSDGAVIEYDRKTHHLSAVLPSGATTRLVSEGGISITGDVTVTGNIKASGDITDQTRSMHRDREIFNFHNHSGVATGLGNTAIPNQSQ